MRFELEHGVRRSDGGRLLTGGTPPRLLRLSGAGARVLDRILAGGTLDPAGLSLAAKLAGEGTIAPLPPVPAPARTLTTVVPVRDGGPGLEALVAALRERGEVIVVDDRSGDDSRLRAARAGATVLTNAGRAGPAGARNTGLRAARTDLVAFVDADCRVEPGWSDGPAALLEADPRLALAAPRVRSVPGISALARYELRRSPLDLGAYPSLVGPGRRVGYLPAAALVGRRHALLEAGGFDDLLRFGEDVDLIWRLVAAGRLVRYVPAVSVEHAPRASIAAFVEQRRGYGRSAATLEARHPATTPLRAGVPAYLAWAAAVRGPVPAFTVAALAAWRASRRSDDPAARRALGAISAGGQGRATLRLARALRREWLPVTAVALALGGSRVRRAASFALAVDALASVATDGHEAVHPRFVTLGVLDDAAYAAGIWEGAFRAGSPAVLLPRIGARRP
jgi:mycofactocin system glycosyltransferase